jgi:putative glutamine amidotransferase
MARPLIGLTTYGEQAKFGANDTFSAVLPMAYVHAVHESGGRAVLVTQDDPGIDILDELDGIVFTGGPDVSPSLYGEEPHQRTVTRPARDDAELPLLRAAIEADLPTLAICRGMQLMVVAYGGRLHQHLPDVLGHDGHRPTSGPKFGTHPVRFAPGSACHRLLGASTTVNSYHHQGVANVGSLTATGWVPDEMIAGSGELVETVEDPTRRFAIGAQWHPEDTDDFRLFAALVAAARESRAGSRHRSALSRSIA